MNQIFYRLRPREPRDDAADAAFDFLHRLQMGQRINLCDLAKIEGILNEANHLAIGETERQDMIQARMFLDILAKTSPDGMILKMYIAALESRLGDVEGELAELRPQQN